MNKNADVTAICDKNCCGKKDGIVCTPKKMYTLFGIACFFAGIVVGFLISPIKNGASWGNNNGNTTNNVFKDNCESEDEEAAASEEGEDTPEDNA